jgi:hypothetical protein
MSALGVYFGPSAISVVETKGKKVAANIKIPQAALSSGELEEKVPEDIKMVAAFKDELRRNRVGVKEATVALSGKDLIIRTFEMPTLGRQDLGTAINFEARKYLPFKPEELILDYQLYYDKSEQKNLVLLEGIKKEVLDKYLSIFSQLNLKIRTIECAAFSSLRLLQLAGIKTKGVTAVIAADLKEADEINFTVLEGGFPLFSRDIILGAGPEGAPSAEEEGSGMLLEKFKTEIRISLDYYQRKFPAKKVANTVFILSRDYQPDAESFIKELGLVPQFIDVNKCLDKPLPFSLGFLKGYTSSLAGSVKMPLKINLLAAKGRAEKKVSAGPQLSLAILKGLNISPKAIAVGILLCAAAFGFGMYQKMPVQKELEGLRAAQPKVATVSPQASLEELSAVDSQYKDKAAALDNAIRNQLYLTDPLDVIPRLVPQGMWLENFSYRNTKDRAELILDGSVYLSDPGQEFEAVNTLAAKLKAEPAFSKYFKSIEVVSLDSRKLRDISITSFSISCQTDKEMSRVPRASEEGEGE